MMISSNFLGQIHKKQQQHNLKVIKIVVLHHVLQEAQRTIPKEKENTQKLA